ncbi:uncharacterized protein N7479_010173 [Penicillium vulpinum]|uniref:Clr5 domain-containing protein n=1 Tax=Penicillium vulpinum TaxID=29845 RepID=A0A1V6RVD5_9EURO|nr:uncharacterized protein N7479_010173 [Penicillium vulpinum]KAJ5951760.1 hypothetical protein N7479_010173 [Penicillium vulpinum]OQE05576.1 hypothetical protein PENVUL_c023G05975 [Penicillium vulpinum]
MMKTSISSDVWEKKKALISKLYMEEEWPLKQVIKQIRTDDFNPSETQLRSRLKKWRVTKPSRQTRKKSLASASGEEPDADKDVHKASIQRPLPSLPTKETLTPHHEWPMIQPIYGQASITHHPVPEQERKWSSPMIQRLTPSPSDEHILVPGRTKAVSYPDTSPTTKSFDHTSPVGEGLMVNTTSAIVPSYPAYPLSPESCLPSPGTTTTPGGIGWSPRAVSVDYGLNPAQWYSLPFEAITPPAATPQSTAAPMAPSINGYLPQAQLYHSHYQQHYSEAPEYPNCYDAKNWKRAMSLQYDMAGHLAARPEHDMKQMLPHTQPHEQSHTMASPSHAQSGGPHSVMCAPIMSYMGHDHHVQKPPGIGY